jgi:hypothetical protein
MSPAEIKSIVSKIPAKIVAEILSLEIPTVLKWARILDAKDKIDRG